MSSGGFALSESEIRICQDIGSRRDAMLHDLSRYVAIPTGWNHTSGLDEFRGLVLDRLHPLGTAVRMVPGDPAPDWFWRGGRSGKPNASIPASAVCSRAVDGLPRILLASHLDTVFDPNGDFREIQIAADGKTAIGPGVVDMKGGIVIALHALEALEQSGVRVSWTYLFNSDEETGSYHSEAALRAAAVEHDVGLCTEPALPGGELAIERGGSGQFVVEVRGRSAHVGREFEKGVSAVTGLAEALVKIAAMPDPAVGRVISVGPLQGGAATNAVPDLARAWGNVRYPRAEVAEELGSMLDALQTEAGATPSIAVKRSFNRPAKPLTESVQQLGELAQSCAASLDQRLPFARTGGVCDGNILQQAGLPTIDTLGVRGGGLHTPDEWIDLSSLVERCQLLALLLSRIASGALAG